MTQQAHNLLIELDDRQQRMLLLIRGRKFSRAFDAIFRSDGISIIRTPIQAPNANAYAERWVGSVRRECLDRILIFGRRQLDTVLRVYACHYNQHRPHRALELRPPTSVDEPLPRSDLSTAASVQRHDLLGGLLHDTKLPPDRICAPHATWKPSECPSGRIRRGSQSPLGLLQTHVATAKTRRDHAAVRATSIQPDVSQLAGVTAGRPLRLGRAREPSV
jgi:putative transposase